MGLEVVTKKLRRRLDSSMSEPNVRKYVIDPILDELGWDTPERNETEYFVGTKKVDYALKVHGRPFVFVEVKKEGNLAESGEDQLFEYAATKGGVPLLVLTDGNVWKFYLSMADGLPSERLFLELSLKESDSSPNLLTEMEAVLHYNNVESYSARRRAEELLDKKREPERRWSALTEIWAKVLKYPEGNLVVEYLLEEVRDAGIAADVEHVTEFLTDLNSADQISSLGTHPTRVSTPSPRIVVGTPKRKPKSGKTSSKARTKLKGFTFGGKVYSEENSVNTLKAVLVLLASGDKRFLSRLESATTTKKSRFVSRDRDKVYHAATLKRKIHDLGNGWYVGVNLSTAQSVDKIEKACEVAGVKFEKDLKLIPAE